MLGETLSMVISIVFISPVYAFCIFKVFGMTIMKEIDGFAGFMALLLLFVGLVAALTTRDPVLQGAMVVCTLSLVIFFPFADDYLARSDVADINAEQIDRGHLELSLRPDNFPAWFKLAANLYDHGFRGHAIALADMTLERIPSETDPFHNRSLRDMFRHEERQVAMWKRDTTDPKHFAPIACPKCKAMNPPGSVNCARCQAPFLLLLSRQGRGRGRAYARLVLGWSLISCLIPLAAWLGLTGLGWAVFVLIGTVGGVLFWVFRARNPITDISRPFS